MSKLIGIFLLGLIIGACLTASYEVKDREPRSSAGPEWLTHLPRIAAPAFEAVNQQDNRSSH